MRCSLLVEELDLGNRPLGISVLSALVLIGGIIALVVGGLVVTKSSTATVYRYGALTGLTAVTFGALVIVIGILGIAAGWGMRSGRGWAWTLSVILGGIGIVLSLPWIALGSSTYVLDLLIDVYLLWYLWRPHIKAFFGKNGHAPPSP
jgi:lysylphosphatidylglycerol synthetase-like protein (DUF2156 family)